MTPETEQTRRATRSPWCAVRAVIGPLLFILALVVLAELLGMRTSKADELDRAEQWFNSLDTLEARFTQVSSDGSYSEGNFFLLRPYRSRFDYDDPIPLVLITTENWLHVDEQDQRRVTSYPISETPLKALLAETVRLTSPDFTTSSEIVEGVVRITIIHSGNTAAGELVLEFTESPFELRRWLITDANGITTTVLLSNMFKGRKIPAGLFVPNSYPNDPNSN